VRCMGEVWDLYLLVSQPSYKRQHLEVRGRFERGSRRGTITLDYLIFVH
jgi:hypothetical protein